MIPEQIANNVQTLAHKIMCIFANQLPASSEVISNQVLTFLVVCLQMLAPTTKMLVVVMAGVSLIAARGMGTLANATRVISSDKTAVRILMSAEKGFAETVDVTTPMVVLNASALLAFTCLLTKENA